MGGWWRSGSGGGIWVDTENLESTGGIGVLSANAQRGKGAGGRIALYYRNNNGFILDALHLQAHGAQDGFDAGIPTTGGGPGTVYIERKGTDNPLQGTLLVDNRNFNSREAYVSPGVYQFKSVMTKRYGHVVFDGSSAADIVTITSGLGFDGDSTRPRVIFNGLLRYQPTIPGSVLTVSGVDIGLKGDVEGISDIEIGKTQIAAVTLYANTWAHNKDVPWNFGNVTVGPQGFWYMQGFDSGDTLWDNDYGVSVTATNVTVENGGQISAEGRGYIGGPGEGQTTCSGASYGGYGGNGCGNAKMPYGSIYEPIDLGSGATEGPSYGGGAIKLVVSGTLRVDGRINADNRNVMGGFWRSGSGGGIWVDTVTLASTDGNGTFSANAQQGRGSGGRIALYYQNNNGFVLDSAHLQAYGAGGGYDVNNPLTGGAPGTVYVEHKGVNQPLKGILLIDNNGLNGRDAYVLPGQYEFEQIVLKRNGHVMFAGNSDQEYVTLRSGLALVGDTSKSKLTINGVLRYEPPVLTDILQVNGIDLGLNGDATGIGNFSVGVSQPSAVTLYAHTWARDNQTPWIFQSILVGPQGFLYLQGYDSGDLDWTNDYGVSVVSDNVTVNSGGQINADARGYIRGPTGGGASGASHGGYGGTGQTAALAPYGDLYQPITLGSGGTESATYGGGAIKLTVNNELVVDGIISANSSSNIGSWYRSGSGGSIYIETKDLTSSSGGGIIRANNVNGRGSGGRVAVYYENNSGFIFDKDHIQSMGGDAGYNQVLETAGGPGTVYWEHKGVDRLGGGSLLLHNNNHVGRAQDFAAGTYYFHDVTITQNVRLWVQSNQTTGEGVLFDTTGNFTLEQGASILGNGAGYSSDMGTGKGAIGVGYSGGGGGAHGGDGGDGQSDGVNPAATGGLKYGDQLLPLSIGSGGGSSAVGALGGKGGGSFALIAKGLFAQDGSRLFGRMDIAGTIQMNGDIGNTGSPGGGGGAGGSILLQGNSCAISGNLSAEGGAGGNSDVDGGAGGGGHISILYNQGPCDVSGLVSVASGVPVDPANYWASYAQVGTYPPVPNSVPVSPQYKEQFEPLTTDVIIPVSGTIGGTTVKFAAEVSDFGAGPSTPKRLSAQFEIKPVGVAFDGATDLYSTAIITYSGGNPIVVSTTIPGLVLGSSYHWRARSVNADNGLVSDWSNFGGNAETVADFSITTVAYLEIAVVPNDMELTDTATLTVTAYDQNGQVDPSYRGTIHTSASSNTALLPADYTFTGTDAGAHVFTDEVKFFEVGTFDITVQDIVNTSLTDTVPITIRDPQVPILSITADDNTVPYQGQTTLRWSSAYVNNLSIDNAIGSVGSSGSLPVTPTGTTTYTITGTSVYGDPMQASVTVTVASPSEPMLSFTATLLQIPAGAETQLQWSSTLVSNLSIDNGIGSVTSSGNRLVSPAQTTTYVITGTTELGASITRQVTITVVPAGIPQLSFGASKLTIRPGESVSLYWASSNMTNLTISQGIGSVIATGETGVTLTNTTTYIISGTSPTGQFMQSQVTITVVPIVVTGTPTPTVAATGTVMVTPSPTGQVVQPPSCPYIDSFSASAYVIEPNRAITLQWNVVGVQKVKIDAVSGDSPAQGSMSIAPRKSMDITLRVPSVLPQCQVSKTIHIEVVGSLPWKNAGVLLIGILVAEILQGNVWYGLLGILDRAKKKIPWGVLYDSVTKKLLARGTVRLWNAISGKIVDTVVSDAQGVFHLQPQKGNYILKVSLPGYEYPSKLVPQNADSGYMNVYHGEVIVVEDDKQPIMVAVPLDPQQGTVSIRERIRRLVQRGLNLLAVVNVVVLWAGFVYSIIVTIMFPVALNVAILVVYCVMIAFWIFDRVRKPKLTGNVTDVHGKAVAGLELGLFDVEYNTLIARTFTSRMGAYSFVVANKDYNLKVIDMKYKLLQQGVSKDGLFLKKDTKGASVRMVTTDLVVYQ